MSIHVNVINQKMYVSSALDSVVAGSQNFVKFRFHLSEDWDGLKVFAQFAQSGVAYNRYLNDENVVYLPHEITAGYCTLMLYGSHDQTIGTSNYIMFKVGENKLITDATSTDISESLYAQLVTLVNTNKARIDNLILSDGISGDTEVVDARVDFMGNTWSCAGEAIREITKGLASGALIENGSITKDRLSDDLHYNVLVNEKLSFDTVNYFDADSPLNMTGYYIGIDGFIDGSDAKDEHGRQIYGITHPIFMNMAHRYRLTHAPAQGEVYRAARVDNGGNFIEAVETKKIIMGDITIEYFVPNVSGWYVFNYDPRYANDPNSNYAMMVCRNIDYPPFIDGKVNFIPYSETLNAKIKGENIVGDIPAVALGADKYVVNLGDSIFGLYHDDHAISNKLAQKLGCEVVNGGFGYTGLVPSVGCSEYFSGVAIADAIASGDWTVLDEQAPNIESQYGIAYYDNTVTALKAVDFTKVTNITLNYGTNDWDGNITIDGEDTDSYKGALRYVIDTLQTAYPNAKLQVVSVINRFFADDTGVIVDDALSKTNNNGDTLIDFFNAAKSICEEKFVDFVNVLDTTGFNRTTKEYYFGDSEVYPNEYGNDILADILAGALLYGCGSSGGSNISHIFTVTVTGDDNNGYTADKTFAEVTAACYDGKIVQCRIGNYILPLCSSNNNCHIYGNTVGNTTGAVIQNSDNTCSAYMTEFAPTGVTFAKITFDDDNSATIDPSGSEIYTMVESGVSEPILAGVVDGVTRFYRLNRNETSLVNGQKYTFEWTDGINIDTISVASNGVISHGSGCLWAADFGAIPAPENASVGQALAVKAVDENGKPTEWGVVDFPSGDSDNELVVQVTDSEATFIADKTFEDIVSAYQAGHDVRCTFMVMVLPLVRVAQDKCTFTCVYNAQIYSINIGIDNSVVISNEEIGDNGGTVKTVDGISPDESGNVALSDYPILLPTGTWRGNTDYTTVTEIRFVESYNPESYDETWDAGEVAGSITAYREGDILTVSANGKRKIKLSTNVAGMFYSCRKLKTILGLDMLDASAVTNIGGMFVNCHALTSVDMSQWYCGKVTKMGGVFQYCHDLQSVKMPHGLNSETVTVTASVFEDCFKLREVDMANGPISVGDRMFAKCINLEHVSGLGAVTTVGTKAFIYCAKLKSIDLNPAILTSIGESAFRLSSIEDCINMDELNTDCVIADYATRSRRWSDNAVLAAIQNKPIPTILLNVPHADSQKRYTDVKFGHRNVPWDDTEDAVDVYIAEGGCSALSLYHEWQCIHHGTELEKDNFLHYWEAFEGDNFVNNNTEEKMADYFPVQAEMLGWGHSEEFITTADQYDVIIDRLNKHMPTCTIMRTAGNSGHHAVVIVGADALSRKLAVLDSAVTSESAVLTWVKFEDIFSGSDYNDGDYDRLVVHTYGDSFKGYEPPEYIPAPETATVGQVSVVKAVDESGKPTEWEATDFPSVSGGGNQWQLINTITTTEDALSRVTCTTDSAGQPFSLTEVYVKTLLPVSTTATGSNFIYLNGGYFNGPVAGAKIGYGSLYANGVLNQVSTANGEYAQWYLQGNRPIPNAPYITKVELVGQSGGKNIPLGTTLEIWGR